MKKLALAVLLSVVSVSMVSAAEIVQKYWERAELVRTTGDDFRNMAVDADHIVVLDRQVPAENAIKIYNSTTGMRNIRLESMSQAGIPTGLYRLLAGDFSDDGAFFACSLSYGATVNLSVYYWANIDADPVKIVDSGGAWLGYRMGDALDVSGSVSDNSVSVLISGNNAASLPLRLTTTDNGATWSSTTLANPVRAVDIDQIAGGDFYATYSGGNIVRYNADGSVALDWGLGGVVSSIAVDEGAGLLYTMSYQTNAYLQVFDVATQTLLADLSADPLDAGGFTAGTANGSSAVEVLPSPSGSGAYVLALSERNGVAKYSYSTVVNVPGDEATIADVITAYGTTYSTATQPLVVAVDPSTSYTEALDLGYASAGTALFGDIVLKSANPAQKVVLYNLRSPASGDDGFTIGTLDKNVTVMDFVLAPAAAGGLLVTDDMVKIDEPAANTVQNWAEFYRCVLTNVDTAGRAMVTSKAEALVTAPPTAGGPLVGAGQGDCLIKQWNDAGESRNLFMEDCLIYSTPWIDYLITDGIADEQMYLHKIWCMYSGAYALITAVRGGNAIDYFRISGVDAGAGPDSASFFYGNGGHDMYPGYANNAGILKIDNVLCYNSGTGRNISNGGWMDLQLRDSILFTSGNPNIVDGQYNYPEFPPIWERVTLNDTVGAYFSTGGTEPLTITDAVVGAPAFGSQDYVTFNNSLLTSGSVTTAVTNNCLIGDPVYVTTNPLDSQMADITNYACAGAALGGGDLAGGADYYQSWEYVGGEYTNGDANLIEHVSGEDILNTKTISTIAGGWYVIGGNGNGASLTNGVFDAGGVADLVQDGASPSPAVTLEYDFAANDSEVADIYKIVVFAGHDGDGSRGFINTDIEIDLGAGYVPLASITTGPFGLSPSAANSAWTKWDGVLDNVQRIKFLVYDVSHNSTGWFQDPNDNTTNPPLNYPNQGVILKEIDIHGTVEPVTASVQDWTLF